MMETVAILGSLALVGWWFLPPQWDPRVMRRERAIGSTRLLSVMRGKR